MPAGNGRPSGQWVGANSSDSTATAAPKDNRPNILPIVDAAYQGTYHDIVCDQFADDLRAAGNTVITEVPLGMPGDPPPPPARIDIMLRNVNGVLFAIEVKTGDDPKFTTPQMIVYPHLLVGDIVFSVDPRVALLGLTPGAPLPPIETVVLYAPGPGSPMRFAPLSSYLRE